MTEPLPVRLATLKAAGGVLSRVCLECGTEFHTVKRHAEFCTDKCRKSFNNRRAMRGAEILDLVMVLRYERKLATGLNLWRSVCRMAMGFREEDVRERAGRRSWRRARDVLATRPYLDATVIANDAGGLQGRRKWRT